MLYLRYFILFLFSFLLIIAVSAIASYSFPLKFLLGNFIYLIVTLILLYKLNFIKGKLILFILIIPVLLFNISFNIFDFNRTFLSLPANINLLIAIIVAYYVFKTKSRSNKFLIISINCLFSLIFFLYGYNYISNKVNYGVYINNVNELLPDIYFIDEKDNFYNKTSFSSPDKIFLLDFWNSRCAPCFRMFPVIDSINKSKEAGIEIYSVNIPFKHESPQSNYGKLQKLGYSFKNLYALNQNIVNDLSIISYPTVIVVKGSNIVYRGDFLSAYKFAQKL